MAKKLALFDVCGTLYDANTTYGFLEHYHSLAGSNLFHRQRARWLSKSSPHFYIGALAYRLLGSDLARTQLVATLEGALQADLMKAARDYVATVLPLRRNERLHTLLSEHIAAGDRVVLVSNSLDVVIQSIAETLAVEHLASRLGFEADICTGRLELDLAGRKAEAVRAAFDLGLAGEVRVYTDNVTDKDLVAISSHATIVIPAGKNSRAWREHEGEFVHL